MNGIDLRRSEPDDEADLLAGAWCTQAVDPAKLPINVTVHVLVRL